MALHVVLHHRRDPNQPWVNDWTDDDLIAAITTTWHIGKLCLQAKLCGQQVFVHRCAYGSHPAIVSCAAHVSNIHRLPGDGALVQFAHTVKLLHVPPGNPAQGQNYYS